jgi:hypothetical protein
MHFRMRATAAAVPVAIALVGGCGATGSTAQNPGPPKQPPSSAASAAAAGNGIDRLSPGEILRRAKAASTSARSVRIRGTDREDGNVTGIDLRVAGKDRAVGTISMHGRHVQVIRIGGTAYIKGDAAFLKAVGGGAAVRLLGGKYIRTRADAKEFASLLSFTLVTGLYDELLKVDGQLSKAGREQLNGTSVITLVDGAGGKVYVAAEGRPYVLRVSPDGGPDHLDFAYNVKVGIRRPPARLVVDVPASA